MIPLPVDIYNSIEIRYNTGKKGWDGMKVGLVLEGGAMRGVFTAGVIDAFLDEGIDANVCIAVSAGACLACSYLCRQRGRGYATMTDYLDEKDYCSLSSLIRTGDLFGAEFLYHKIPEELYPIDHSAFLNGNTEFYTVITNCRTGKPEYPRIRDMYRDIDYIRASSSLPLLARMVELNGEMYLDGGVSDPVPVLRALEMGCDKVIVVLTRHREFRKSPEFSVPLMLGKYRRYPNLIHDMKIRHEVYNNTLARIARWEREGRIFVIAPDHPLDISRAEKNGERLRQGYTHGCEVARELMPRMKAYLK